MITGFNLRYAGITCSVAATALVKVENPLQFVSKPRPDDAGTIRISDETGSVRPFAPKADTKLTLSGSIVFELNSLLVDLSNVDRTKEMPQLPQPTNPVGRYQQPSLHFLQLENKPLEEPVWHTFEIIV
jgi:hypothetical protein